MSISSLFQRLGAPLANNRWSWGAERASDGAVFLRVWQDHKFMEGDRSYFQVDRHTPAEIGSPGLRERLRHIEQIRSGAPCFLVMCRAVDIHVVPRTIQDFDDIDLFVGGDIVERDGAVWVQKTGRRSVDSLVPR
jgi:hypothetical protein